MLAKAQNIGSWHVGAHGFLPASIFFYFGRGFCHSPATRDSASQPSMRGFTPRLSISIVLVKTCMFCLFLFMMFYKGSKYNSWHVVAMVLLTTPISNIPIKGSDICQPKEIQTASQPCVDSYSDSQ